MNRKDRRAAGKRAARGARRTMRRRCLRLPCAIIRPGICSRPRASTGKCWQLDRNHFGSLHHLGIMALQRGQPQAAVEVIGRAIAINRSRSGLPLQHGVCAAVARPAAMRRPRHYQRGRQAQARLCRGAYQSRQRAQRARPLRRCRAAYERVIALEPERGSPLQSRQYARPARPSGRGGEPLSARARARAGSWWARTTISPMRWWRKADWTKR